MPAWERSVIVVAVLVATAVVAKLIDHAIAKRELDPAARTRYRILRRTVTAGIFAVGVFSALLVIPQVRAIAGGLLASSAVIGLVIGFAARTTLGNFVAGVLIAFTQPVRLGDEVVLGEDVGTVEEIGLTYTFVRTEDNARLVIPNERLASDTIRNTTIVDRTTVAEVTVQVPLTQDLDAVVGVLQEQVRDERDPDVEVLGLAEKVTVAVRARAADEHEARRLESDLRLRTHRALLEAGMLA
jgi:small-conductance mechanosensitive channel